MMMRAVWTMVRTKSAMRRPVRLALDKVTRMRSDWLTSSVGGMAG